MVLVPLATIILCQLSRMEGYSARASRTCTHSSKHVFHLRLFCGIISYEVVRLLLFGSSCTQKSCSQLLQVCPKTYTLSPSVEIPSPSVEATAEPDVKQKLVCCLSSADNNRLLAQKLIKNTCIVCIYQSELVFDVSFPSISFVTHYL